MLLIQKQNCHGNRFCKLNQHIKGTSKCGLSGEKIRKCLLQNLNSSNDSFTTHPI